MRDIERATTVPYGTIRRWIEAAQKEDAPALDSTGQQTGAKAQPQSSTEGA